MKKLKVGIDARMWDHPGIGRYIRELSAELALKNSLYDIILLGSGQKIKDAAFDTGSIRVREASSNIYSLWEQLEIPQKTKDLDLLHVPHFNIPVFFSKKLVVTIHDLIYLNDPASSRSKWGPAYVKWLLKMAEKKASAIITVSEYTKNDLIRIIPSFPKEKIFVIYEAASSNFKKITEPEKLKSVKERYGLNKPFVLCVGSLKTHKNIPTLIKAVERVRQDRGLDCELILVGRKDPKNQGLLDLISKHAFVRHLGELSDSDIVALYNLAQVFVLPSFWEGFGLPILEAMACGTPVISSNAASLPEVVGDAGLLFSPNDVDALTQLIYNVLFDNKLREKMSTMGFEQVKKFSWQETARQTLQVYQQVLADPR